MHTTFTNSITLEKLQAIMLEALEQSKIMHDMLGRNGLKQVKNNRFGEMALTVDVQCEDTILKYLGLPKHGLRIRVDTEEHGRVDIGFGAGESPDYFGVIDGLDGSKMAELGWGINRYGTMFGIYQGAEPTYDDYLVVGYMEHASKSLYIATKGRGAFLMVSGKFVRLTTSGKTSLGTEARIYVDEYFDFNIKTFSDKLRDFKPNTGTFYGGTSAAVAFMGVASGEADFYLRSTVKGNLEPMVAYGLITEAGGAMVDQNGKSFGPKKYLSYGQGSEMLPIITAATLELAREMAAHLAWD